MQSETADSTKHNIVLDFGPLAPLLQYFVHLPAAEY